MIGFNWDRALPASYWELLGVEILFSTIVFIFFSNVKLTPQRLTRTLIYWKIPLIFLKIRPSLTWLQGSKPTTARAQVATAHCFALLVFLSLMGLSVHFVFLISRSSIKESSKGKQTPQFSTFVFVCHKKSLLADWLWLDKFNYLSEITSLCTNYIKQVQTFYLFDISCNTYTTCTASIPLERFFIRVMFGKRLSLLNG